MDIRNLIIRGTFAVILFFAIGTEAYAAILVGYWPFEEREGAVVEDQSAFGNDGMLTGAARAAGKTGGGLFFDGTGGVTVPASASLNALPGGFTMSAWIYPTDYPDFVTLFWKTDRNDRVDMLHFQVGDNQNLPTGEGRLYAAMNGPTGASGTPDLELIAPPTVGLDEWHFVAWTYDEATATLWDNGVPVLSLPFSDPWAGNDHDLLIGQHQELAFANFRGFMDEARIYQGALSQDEIIRDMNSSGIIPEPSTIFLVGVSLLGLALGRKLT